LVGTLEGGDLGVEPAFVLRQEVGGGDRRQGEHPTDEMKDPAWVLEATS